MSMSDEQPTGEEASEATAPEASESTPTEPTPAAADAEDRAPEDLDPWPGGLLQQYPIAVDLAKQGAQPRLKRAAAENKSTYPVYLYSDLKRHVVGPNLREGRAYRGVSAASFRTPPLWGIARSRPYPHDARAPELEIAITEHFVDLCFHRLWQPSFTILRY